MTTKIHYEEWLKKDGAPFAAGLIRNFFSSVSSGPERLFRMKILRYSKSANPGYRDTRLPNPDTNLDALLELFGQYVQMDSAIAFRLSASIPLDPLLSNFTRDNSGELTPQISRTIFRGSDDLAEWWSFRSDEILLLVFHDGDPIIVLRKT